MKNFNPVPFKYILFYLAGFFLLVSFKTVFSNIPVSVGMYQNPPKIYLDENGKPAGILVDLLEEIARLENWEINYVNNNWNACLNSLKNGEIDIMPDMAFSVERQDFYDFNKIPVLESWSELYTSPGSGIEQLSDLNGKRVAALDGSVQQFKFYQIMNGYNYHFHEIKANSFKDAFSLVSIGIADAVISNHFFGDTHYKLFNLEKNNIIFHPTLIHFAVRKGENNHLLQTIDMYLEEWINTPLSFYYTTLSKHSNQPVIHPKKGMSAGLVFSIVGFSILAVFLILFLRWQLWVKTKKLNSSKKKNLEEISKFKNYFDNSPFGIFVTNAQGQFEEINQAACQITGYSCQELIQKSIPDLFPEHAQEDALKHFKEVVDYGKATGTFPFLTKNRDIRFWIVDAVKISDTRFLGFTIDITNRIKIEKELLELKEKLEFQVDEKTRELSQRISELELFREVTIERELRMEELRNEIKLLKKEKNIVND